MFRLRTSAAVVAVLSLSGLTACTSGREATPSLPGPSSTTPPPSPSPRATKAGELAGRLALHAKDIATALRPYADCTALLKGLRAEALKEVTPYGLSTPYYGGYGMGGDVVPVAAGGAMGGTAGTTGGSTGGAAPAAAPQSASGGAASGGFSTTNNQEAGVDEPDTVKTDGTVMAVLRQNPASLQVLDVSSSHPKVVGSLPISLQGYGLQLLMSKRTVVVLGQRQTGSTVMVVAEVYSLTDPEKPTHLRTFQVEGTLLDARFVHGRILLVTHNQPRLRFEPYPYDVAPAVANQTALALNKAKIQAATPSDWLPSVKVTPRGKTYPARCDQTEHSGVESGTASTSIVTLDPEADQPTSNTTVIGSGDIMYASQDQLYLATSSWKSQGFVARGFVDGVTTDLHAFGIHNPDEPTYLGTGSLPGNLVDRYALSEDHGYLRVATTVGSPVPPVGEGARPSVLSDNRVTVLKPVDGVLTKVGEVRGLARGQKIFGVRFLGDIGYVVTFRSIDPLYTLDLSDPEHPRTRGELHISGYSSALYPLSTGKLLGVGQAVGDHQQQLGAQAEVFDVSSLARPKLVGKKVWANAYSDAASDHHALLWWQPEGLVVMPLSGSGNQLVVLKVSSSGALSEVGRIRHPQGGGTGGSSSGSSGVACCYYGESQTRAVVVGNLLYSVLGDGVVTNPLDEVTAQRWLPFR